MRKSGPIDTQVWGHFFATRHPVKTAAAVAARIRISERTVEKWLEGTASPSLQAFGRLVRAYGPEFLAICLPGCEWLGTAARAARRESLAVELARIAAELGELQERL
ncbi:conserved hypothetical protein [Methylocella tundrae]|nr:conserved hypothetical protein [Methylocella tundrae]